ncbi:MAG: DUF4476 domain-containing protein, partial [Lacibacter sp.]
DNQQPFYIKYNNRIYSSSASGYLILSKLKEGTVDFSVGFPKSNQPEQKFQCLLENADKGYLIKNFADKGWGLYDLQSSAIVYAGVTSEIKTNNPAVTTSQPVTDDPFANMLSKVTQDTTVKNVTVRKEEKVIVDTPKPAVVTETVAIVPQVKDTIKTQVVQQPVQVVEAPVTEPAWVAPAKSSVLQVRKFDSREGSDFVYEVVNTDGVKDTVRLFIAKDPVGIEPVQQPAVNTEVKTDTIQVIKEQKIETPSEPVIKKEEKKEAPAEPVVKKEEIRPLVIAEQKTEPKALPNSNCTSIASEDDFMKLRKKMASESKDESMINVAKKAFRTKCFSTAQIKNLAVLFLNDEGRYRFYDAAMLYITDFSNFKNLGETIQDEYYKKRFSALLPNQ